MKEKLTLLVEECRRKEQMNPPSLLHITHPLLHIKKL